MWKIRFSFQNQILVFFLSLMAVILTVVGIISYFFVSNILKENTYRQMNQTVLQASGRIDSLHHQIDQLSLQFMTNDVVQNSLTHIYLGNGLSLDERQNLRQIVNRFKVFNDGIREFDIYEINGNNLFPSLEPKLRDFIDEAIRQINLHEKR